MKLKMKKKKKPTNHFLLIGMEIALNLKNYFKRWKCFMQTITDFIHFSKTEGSY